jgi:hypothetical protein
MTDWSIPRILNGHSLEYPTGFNNLPKNKKWIQFKHEFTNSSLLMSDGNSLTLTHWVIPTDWSMHAVKDNCLASRKSEWSHSWRALKIKNWLTISVLHFTPGYYFNSYNDTCYRIHEAFKSFPSSNDIIIVKFRKCCLQRIAYHEH